MSPSDLIFTADLVVGPNGETCPYPWHLGTYPEVMKGCAEEIYHKYRLVPARISEVRISRGRGVELIYDHNGWRTAQ